MRACTGSCAMSSLFVICRARLAYLSVLSVSSMSASDGDTHAIMSVCALPPKESCSSRVSFESLYGTCACLSHSAVMTLPRASSPLLICTPSAKRSPDAPVRLARSDPARSTKLKRGVSSLPLRSRSSKHTVKMACDREDDAFIAVEPVARLEDPSASTPITSSGVVTARACIPGRETLPSLVSRMSSVASFAGAFALAAGADSAPLPAAASEGRCNKS
mmetsp:Transcript_31656/g.102242  ORF Transcript_31656/g.102242 Transcript_31656/m.102242 type:complete len:219 (+) Transcript_31656:2214-2870(+)